MDITSTAQAVTPVTAAIAASIPWWSLLLAALFGVGVAKVNPATIQAAGKEAVSLEPAAATVATLAGQPALAGGLDAAAKVVDAMTKTTDPAQLAALTLTHGQLLAAAGAPAVAPVVAP